MISSLSQLREAWSEHHLASDFFFFFSLMLSLFAILTANQSQDERVQVLSVPTSHVRTNTTTKNAAHHQKTENRRSPQTALRMHVVTDSASIFVYCTCSPNRQKVSTAIRDFIAEVLCPVGPLPPSPHSTVLSGCLPEGIVGASPACVWLCLLFSDSRKKVFFPVWIIHSELDFPAHAGAVLSRLSPAELQCSLFLSVVCRCVLDGGGGGYLWFRFLHGLLLFWISSLRCIWSFR